MAPGLGARRQAFPALFEHAPATEGFLAPPRKSVAGGSIRAIAIYTIGDEMANYWKAYAEDFLKETPGVAFGAHTQAEAARKLNKLKDTDLVKVYFIGHGYAGGPHPRKPDLVRDPTFMLSGVHSGGTFANNSDPDKNLTPQPGPLIEALAPHLSRDSSVTMYFLSCHTGTDKLMQEGMVRLVRKYAPGVSITALGYRQYYGVQKIVPSPRAHVRDTKAGPPPPESSMTKAPDIPAGYETVVHGDPFKGDDPLKEIDENKTDDPLFGI